MTESVVKSSLFRLQNARKTLDMSVKSWFAFALAGQWAFAIYIFFIYIVTFVYGLDVHDFSPAPGAVKTEGFDRFVFFTHIIPAVYLSFFGLMQLVPGIRNRFKGFHRWNGRIFLVLGFSGALTGLYLQWVTGLRFTDIGSLGITLNGILILFAVYFTWHHAVNKRFDQHMRWAIRCFILVNGVWSFRLYLMGWFFVNQGPNGNSQRLDGPMDIFITFACYLLPLGIAELYFWAKKQRDSNKVWGSTLVMTAGALITLIGVFAAVMMMWMPRISKVLAVI